MNLVIIDENSLAAESLKSILLDVAGNVHFNVILSDPQSTKQYFSTKQEHIDLVFVSIDLSSHAMLSVLRETVLPAPVIFICDRDECMTQVFEQTCIDLVPKPVTQERICTALRKYNKLQTHFNSKINSLVELAAQQVKKYRQRILLKKGREFFFIKTEDIAYIYTDHGIVIIVDFNNQKYISEYKILSAIEQELDPSIFSRINRKYIINIKVIKKFRPFDRVKLSVDFIVPVNEEIIVSQDNATFFKGWVGNRMDALHAS